MRRLALALFVVSCNAPPVAVEESGGNARRVSLTFESWNAYLVNADAVARSPRVDAVADTLAADGSVDVVCLHGVHYDADRERILARTRTLFPYVAFVRTDRTTPYDDPRDLTGATPEPFTTPPCSTPADLVALDQITKCARTSCLAADGSTDLRCVKTTCFPAEGTPRCAFCAESNLQTTTVDETEQACAHDVHGEVAYDGRLGAMLLSRLPLLDTTARRYPSTFGVEGVLETKVDTGGQPLDVFCASFDDIWDTSRPYVGRYAGGGNPLIDTEAEIPRRRVIDLVRTRSRALLFGGGDAQWALVRDDLLDPGREFFATHLAPLVSVDAAHFTFDPKVNPLPRKLGLRTDLRLFEQLAYAHDLAAIIEDVAIARTEARFRVDDAAVPASPAFSVRVKLLIDR